jgi:NADH:ubiquinone oxidoreductase subunit 2 (subunit N)
VTFSLPFILLTGWVLEQYAVSPEDLSLLAQATALLAAGFAFLLAVVPFHSWIPSVAQDASPPAAAFVFTVIQAAVVFFMLEFLGQFDWLGANPQIYALMRLAGVVMVGLGGVFAFSQRSFGRLMGYAVLADYGAVLLAIGHGSADGLRTGIVLIALRGIALAVWGVGMGALRAARPGAGDDDFEHMRGLGRERPLAAAAVVIGGLSLVGFPFTAGFPGRWALWRLLSADYSQASLIILLTTVSVGLAYARGLALLIARPGPEAKTSALAVPEMPALESEPEEREAALTAPGEVAPGALSARLVIALIGVGLTVILALGIYPQWLLPAMARAAEAFIRSAG